MPLFCQSMGNYLSILAFIAPLLRMANDYQARMECNVMRGIEAANPWIPQAPSRLLIAIIHQSYQAQKTQAHIPNIYAG